MLYFHDDYISLGFFCCLLIKIPGNGYNVSIVVKVDYSDIVIDLTGICLFIYDSSRASSSIRKVGIRGQISPLRQLVFPPYGFTDPKFTIDLMHS